MLKIENLTKSFGETSACDIDALTINSGDIVGLIGNNGAGKTTLLRIILDLLKPDNGQVTLYPTTSALSATNNNDEKDVFTGDNEGIVVSEDERWKDYVGAFLSDDFLIDFLTPDEYLSFVCKISSIDKEELEKIKEIFLPFTNGEIFGTKKLIRNLSAGNKQKIGIISVFLRHPQLIILDEPFNFLDPSSQVFLKNFIADYSKDSNATIIISSHNLSQIMDISSRMLLLEKGRIIRDLSTTNQESIDILNNYFNS